MNGRDDWIRTSDLTHPKGALYQAEPRPDTALETRGVLLLSVHERPGLRYCSPRSRCRILRFHKRRFAMVPL